MESGADTETVQTPVESVIAESMVLVGEAEKFLAYLVQPSRIYQVVIIAALFAAAHVLSRIVTPRVTTWLRRREGWPRWRMRFMAVCNQRWRAILFVMLIWLTSGVMQETTWPSRSYLINIVATLATAWLTISIAGRLIRNRTIRKLTVWSAWIFVTLQILGLLGYFASILDAAAVEFGSFRISLLVVVQALLAIGALFACASVISKVAERRIDRVDDMSPSVKVLSVKLIKLSLFGAAFVLGIQAVGFDLTTLTLLSGAIGLGLGFGLQKIVSNLVSGMILLMDKSIKPGDVISLGDKFGWISVLGARYASVVTRDGTEYLIPNEDLITNQVVNWSHSNDFVRLDIGFGVSYNCDPHEVRRIAANSLAGVKRVMSDPPPVCHIAGFGDSSVDFLLRFWIADPARGLANVRGEVFLQLWDAFKAHGVEIPYPRRDISVVETVRSPVSDG